MPPPQRGLTSGHWVIFGGVAVSGLLILALNYYLSELFPEPGVFGDRFGFANAIFGGLAFVGIVGALILQREDLRLQRNSLEETRREIQQQRAIAYKQAFENTYLRLISAFSKSHEIMRDDNLQERLKRFQQALEDFPEKPLSRQAYSALFWEHFDGEEDAIHIPLKMLGPTLGYLKEYKCRKREKKLYIDMLASVLFADECVFLAMVLVAVRGTPFKLSRKTGFFALLLEFVPVRYAVCFPLPENLDDEATSLAAT